MSRPLAFMTDEEGVGVATAELGGFHLAEFRFPPHYLQPPFDPDRPYLAVVLAGGLEKTFRARVLRLGHSGAVTMPAGARHSARFAADGARIVVVKDVTRDDPAPCLGRLAQLQVTTLTSLAWRLAGELHASDTAAPLAAEGLALELLAVASRETSARPWTRRPPPWLGAVEELLHSCVGERLALGDVAGAVGVHPTHLARVFRRFHGVSIGEYVRRARIDWAVARVAGSSAPLAQIAAEAGFADQSHFTRLFKQHVGTTPGRYREEVRRAG